MPKFYLNIFNAHGEALDEEGIDALSQLEARAVAIAGIRSLLAAEVLNGGLDLNGRIEILDASGQLRLVVPFNKAIAISGPII